MLTIRPYDPFRQAESMGAMWTLHKGTRTALCTVSTHPLGWELAVALDGQMVHTQVCKAEQSVFATAQMWRDDWESKGWA